MVAGVDVSSRGGLVGVEVGIEAVKAIVFLSGGDAAIRPADRFREALPPCWRYRS